MMTVHPRVCGELGIFTVGRGNDRFIPACVGNSAFSRSAAAMMTVHPRVCGELSTVLNRRISRHGSSPRVWGTLHIYNVFNSTGRFIPACVGNSDGVAVRTELSPVHPRVCGELDAQFGGAVPITGSSPRVWGTLGSDRQWPGCLRFIPACVGNSPWCWWDCWAGAVHPRVCGELPIGGVHVAVFDGSSPRVWGTHIRKRPRGQYARFIPACVGNSHQETPPWSICSVHPRVCGELTVDITVRAVVDGSSPRVWELRIEDIVDVQQSGSSPRVWGTQTSRPVDWRAHRFIPACVGNSMHSLAAQYHSVHPRVCGELVATQALDVAMDGSSPRVWGTRSNVLNGTPTIRFIPACVGNSGQRQSE